MAFGHDEQRVRAERARTIGLFRYALIREAADEKLSTRQRGRLVRTLAEREHEGPFGQPVRVSRATIDRWIRDWRRGGFDALVPTPRKAVPRTPADVLELAVALKREVPERTAAQIAAILRAHSGWSPDERTLQRNFVRLELTTRADGQPPPSLRAVRGRRAQRAMDRRRAARPDRQWPQGDPVRLPRRPLPVVHRLPVGPPRGHRAAGSRATHRHRQPGYPREHLRRLCRPGRYADPGEDRLLSGGARADDVGIIRGLRGRRAGCRGRGSGLVLCRVGSCARSLVPSGTCRRAGRRSWW